MRFLQLAALATILASVDAGSIGARAAAKVPITMQVYRHANSCANIATQCEDSKNAACKDYDFKIDDSTISNWGVNGSISQSKIIPQPDVVMTSTLMRAIETGLYQFPKLTVYPVPYLKEVDFKPPNNPLVLEQQKAAITELDGAANTARVDYMYEQDAAHNCIKGDATPRCLASWNGFLNFLGETLSKEPPKEISQQVKNGEPVSIALVSHSIMISSQILQKKMYVSNNQGFESMFTFDPATGKVTHDAGAQWTDITLGVKSPCNGRKLTDADTQRCAERNMDTWPEFQKLCLA